MAFDKKTWANNQAGGTPLDASGLNDLEDRIESGIDELDVDLASHKAERASDDVHGLIDLVDNSECARFKISSNQSISSGGAYVRVYLNQVVTNATFATIENGYVKFLKKGLYYLTFQGVFETSSGSGFRQCVIGNAGNVLAFTRYRAAPNVAHAQQVNLTRRFDENELLEINVAMDYTGALNLLANDTFVTISRVGDL